MNSPNIFDLHSTVISDYRDFVRSFFNVADARANDYIERALVDEKWLWPYFLLQVSPSYERTATVDELVERGVLHCQHESKITQMTLYYLMLYSYSSFRQFRDITCLMFHVKIAYQLHQKEGIMREQNNNIIL
jgi:hypothetical protein